jgi:hypothetical protein
MKLRLDEEPLPVLFVYNQSRHHYPHPTPVVDGGMVREPLYVSYFTTLQARGDGKRIRRKQLIFRVGHTGKTVLLSGSARWEPRPVTADEQGDPTCALKLSRAERSWLQACWEATRMLREERPKKWQVEVAAPTAERANGC